MCPRLFQIGPFTVYSYGLMLAIAFISASYLLTIDLKRKGLDPSHGNAITLLALLAGVVGSKLLYLLEHWHYFLADPIGMAFSPGGLTFYGGLLLATFAIYLYTRKKRIAFFTVADAVAPALMLAYGIGRLGCHFAGDGDYGFPTTLPWGTDYSKGTYPPSLAFRDIPEVANNFPGGIVPNNTPCHPTPVYELIICAALFWIMWRYRERIHPKGRMFAAYLALAGLERFSIEFIRLNPRVAFGLTEAQIIALALVIVGLVGWFALSKKSEAKVA